MRLSIPALLFLGIGDGFGRAIANIDLIKITDCGLYMASSLNMDSKVSVCALHNKHCVFYLRVAETANFFSTGCTSITLCVLQRPQATENTLPEEAVQINILQFAQRTGVNPT